MSYNKRDIGFKPNLFEKLFDDTPGQFNDGIAIRRLTLDELKSSVARDLEGLLNTRSVIGNKLQQFQSVQGSIINFGILDFVGLSSANPADCDYICRQLAETIENQDSRLKNVRVSLEVGAITVNQLCFSIKALLKVFPSQELVSFDAYFEPTSQHYEIKT